jgi:hypothetical protein
MVQNSFSLLFLLLLGAGALSLVHSFRNSWSEVSSALAPQETPRGPAVYSTTVRAAAEVPWVAQRLVLRELDEALPPAAVLAPWAVRQPTFA